MTSPAPAIDLEALSEDARALAGAHFALLPPDGESSITFRTPSRITARAQGALDELVTEGVLAVTPPIPNSDARVYTPRVDCRPAVIWLRNFIDEGHGDRIRFALMRDRHPDDHMILERDDG